MLVATILVYLFLLLAASLIIAFRHSRSNDDFFRGGRRSPWYVVAVAMVGTSISGVTFVSVPGMVAASQFSYLQMAVGFVAGYVAIAYILLPLFYKLNLNSLYSYLEGRFGAWSYHTGAGFFLLSKIVSCGVKMYLTAIVLQLTVFDAVGIPFWLNVVVTMIVVWLYTFRGGVRSLVWTDMIQTLSLVATVVLSIVFIGRAMGLDFKGLVGSISDSPMSRIWFFDDLKDTRYFWKQFLSGMFTTIAMTGLDQDMMQKNLSCRSLKESRKNILSYGVAFIPVNLLFLSLGVLLYNFAAAQGITLAKPDDLFPTIACGTDASGAPYMPVIVGVLFVLGLTSASLSSSGSALTALTTTFTLDILKADRHGDEKKTKRTRGWVHVGGAIVMGAVIYAFRMIGNESVINMIYKLVGYTYGPLLGLFFFGILTNRQVRDRAVPFICIASPIICYILSAHSEEWFGGYRIGFELLLINAAITAIGLFLCGIGASSRKSPSARK